MDVVFLIDATFSKRDYDRFGFDIFLKNNINLQLWDFRNLYQRKFKNNGFEEDFDLRNSRIISKVFSSFDELDLITNLNGIFIFDFRVETDSKYTNSWLRDKGAIIVTLEQGLIPLNSWSPKFKDQLIIIRNKFLNKGLLNILKAIFIKIFNKKKIDHSNIRVCSGEISKPSLGEFEIRSHALDYDIFLQEKTRKEKKQEFILFLDCGMTNHPDYQKLNIPPHCSEDVYFPLMRSFFNQVEKKTGLPVIISVHPRIKINDDLSKKFGNRELILNRTAEFVKAAKFILNHDSTAINFVALWKVPMIFITTDEIERAEYSEMESQDQFLKTNRLNINNLYNDIDFYEIAQKPLSQYNRYIEAFIKLNGSSSQHSAEILIQGLKKYVQ